MQQGMDTGRDDAHAAKRVQVRRGPRREEISLMLSLIDGPRRISAGPIGRCVKRGWCAAKFVVPPKAISKSAIVLYELTLEGRALVLSEDVGTAAA